tara:strand:- start:6684 stop:8405 length:1722 start_codon:yes stop_codon:yes gene_type:complete
LIYFREVKFKNFGSFGNYDTSISLDRHRMTLVSGKNGHGKSFALLDSITFALFGKPFRKINLPQLVNSINERDCMVEITFDIGEHNYRVVRGIKPKKFEIYKDGDLLDQTATAKDYQKMLEEQIIKMNYKSFTQVVILGSSSFVPFMQLNASDRRDIIEDILDINVFSVMNTLLKSKIAASKELIKDLDYKIDLIKEKIVVQREYIKTLKERSAQSVGKNKKEIEKSEVLIDALLEEVDSLRERAESRLEDGQEIKKLESKMTKMTSIRGQLERNIKKIEDEIGFFDENNECPTCCQVIDKSSKSIKTHLEKREGKLEEINEALDTMSAEYESLKEQCKKIDEINKEVSELSAEISEKQSSVNASNRYIKKLREEIEDIESDNTEVDEVNDKLKKFDEDRDEFEDGRKELVEDRHYCEIASTLLRDGGIKAKIIKHYLPIINKLINKFLTSMDFFAKFTLDEEFNETIKSRHRDDFSYMSFSEGEKLRIDLALLLTWREIARIKNSANTNLLILDEVFDSSLDAVGTEEFLKLLHAVGNSAHVYVISHKADSLADKFQNSMAFQKQNNFSKLV